MTAPTTASISKREAEVLGAVRQRLSNAEIAEQLHLSVRTVESHVSSLLRKLQAADRRELATRPDLGPGTQHHPNRPPSQWTSFVGREAERAHVIAALGTSRVVTLLGPGGMGKTRLAAAVAAQHGASLPGGAVWVDLVAVQPASLEQAVAVALGVREEPDRQLHELILDRLARQSTLLALDNCEHLVAAVAGFAASVLASCPGVVVLATSRRRIDIPGAHVITVPPLAPDDAVQLFVERAGGTVDPARLAEARQICERLEGMPLPIELAAARVSSLGLPDVLTALDDALDFLSRSQDTDRRHSSVRTVIDWSFRLLDDEERRVFRRLGVFAGGFDLGAVAAVALGSPHDGDARAANVLGRLVDDSLAVRIQTSAGTRWRLLELVRAYAAEQLELSGDAGRTRAAYLRWAADSAARLEEGLSSGDGSWRPEFDAVIEDLRVARDGESSGDDWRRLLPTLAHLLYGSGFLAEARETYVKAADRAPSPRAAVESLVAAADIALAEFDGTRAFECLTRAADIAAEAGDGSAAAVCLARAVITPTRLETAMRERVPYETLAALLEAAQRALPADDPIAEAVVAQARAGLEIRTTPPVVEAESAVAALHLARRTGRPLLISGALDTLAMGALGRGALRAAYAHTVERIAEVGAVAPHDPRGAFEITDLYRMLIEVGSVAGGLTETLETLDGFTGAAAITPRQRATQAAWPLALAGHFDRALDAAALAWAEWGHGRGRPPRGLDEVALAAAFTHGLRGADAQRAEWLERADRAQRAVGHDPACSDIGRYCAARIALFRGNVGLAWRLLEDTVGGSSAWYRARRDFVVDDVYVWALAAEVSVVAAPEHAQRVLAVATDAAAESDWAAAFVARARGRLTGSRVDVEGSLALWEHVGAHFERACTLLLLPDRAAEGEHELAELGCPISS